MFLPLSGGKKKKKEKKEKILRCNRWLPYCKAFPFPFSPIWGVVFIYSIL